MDGKKRLRSRVSAPRGFTIGEMVKIFSVCIIHFFHFKTFISVQKSKTENKRKSNRPRRWPSFLYAPLSIFGVNIEYLWSFWALAGRAWCLHRDAVSWSRLWLRYLSSSETSSGDWMQNVRFKCLTEFHRKLLKSSTVLEMRCSVNRTPDVCATSCR